MCARLWEGEINHQPRDELLKWILVSRLLSLVMAFPSFTIRCTGAEMLCFHFPRVGNSRRPGDGCFWVLLHEQFAAWGLPHSESASSQGLPSVTGPAPAFQHSGWVHVCTRTHPADTRGHTHADRCRQTRKHLRRRLDAANESALDTYSRFFL